MLIKSFEEPFSRNTFLHEFLYERFKSDCKYSFENDFKRNLQDKSIAFYVYNWNYKFKTVVFNVIIVDYLLKKYHIFIKKENYLLSKTKINIYNFKLDEQTSKKYIFVHNQCRTDMTVLFKDNIPQIFYSEVIMGDFRKRNLLGYIGSDFQNTFCLNHSHSNKIRLEADILYNLYYIF